MTATRPAESTMNHMARRQHSASADKLAQRVTSCAHAVRLDLAHGRPAQAAARQLLADAIALVEKLAELREAEKWTRQPAA